MNFKTASKMAEAVYSKDLNKFNKLGYEKCYDVVSDNDYAVVAVNAIEICVVFRGSDDMKDWFDNLDFMSDKDHFFKRAHGGFMKSYESIELDLMKIVNSLIDDNPGLDIKVIGHSKGGAMAELCAMVIADHSHEVSLFTFGSPRVGKKSYKKKFKKLNIKYYRFVNGKDPVPRIPRKYMGFKHMVKPITMKDGWFTWLWIGDFKDHLMPNYVKNIRKL